MRAREFITESKKVIVEALAMREYAHPEEYLIKDGVGAGIEILQDFKEDLQQPESLNLKWDGKAAIYWGRDESGQFYMVPNNQWNKGQKLTKDELEGEIKRTGRKLPSQSDEEFAAIRASMAANYGRQWQLLEKSSPKAGFFWGDIMFETTPEKNADGNYEFTPNKITYVVDPTKELGQYISKGAELFITIHGLVKEFGVDPTSDLTPVGQAELSALNRANPKVFLLSERPQQAPIKTDTKFIDDAIGVLAKNQQVVDSFMNYTAPKFTGFKNILRDWADKWVKSKGTLDFDAFVEQSKLSDNQRQLTRDYVAKNPQGFEAFKQSITTMIDAKNKVFAQLQGSHSQSMQDRLGISAHIGGTPGGEGFAKIRKSGAGIKYVNPEFRSAPVNQRFVG